MGYCGCARILQLGTLSGSVVAPDVAQRATRRLEGVCWAVDYSVCSYVWQRGYLGVGRGSMVSPRLCNHCPKGLFLRAAARVPL